MALGSMAYALSSEFDYSRTVRLPLVGELHIVGILVPITLFSLGLFVCCMACHGELARMKPHPRYLTQFYVMVSVGGAVGGVMVGLIAPHLFNAYYELPIALVATGVMVTVDAAGMVNGVDGVDCSVSNHFW